MSSTKLTLVLSLFLSVSSFADPFHPGEKLNYSIRWKGFSAIRLTTTIKDPVKDKSGNVIYPLEAKAKSTFAFKFVHSADYTASSSWDQNFFSRSVNLNMIDDKEHDEQVAVFNYQTNETILHRKHYFSDKEGTPATTHQKFPLGEATQDPLSMIYYMRVAKLPSLGQKTSFPIVWNGESYDSVIKNVGTQKIDLDGDDVDADIFTLDFSQDGKVTNGGNKMWVSRDSRHLILRLETTVQSIKAAITLDSIK
jgi:hypothetical protein